MAWCPKCRYEFREGITTCTDCECELVDDLSFATLEEENEHIDPDVLQMQFQQSLMQASESFNLEYDEEGMPDPIALMQASSRAKQPPKAEVYINNEERAEENKSAAYALLLVGVAGIILIVLFFLDIIPIPMSRFSKYMITGVMGVMFILFFIMGIVSLRNFKLFKEKAYKENNLTKSIKDWCMSSLSKEDVDSNFDFDGVPEEIKYFQRIGFLKNSINKQFMNLDEGYLDRLVEEVYPDIFEKE